MTGETDSQPLPAPRPMSEATDGVAILEPLNISENEKCSRAPIVILQQSSLSLTKCFLLARHYSTSFRYVVYRILTHTQKSPLTRLESCPHFTEEKTKIHKDQKGDEPEFKSKQDGPAPTSTQTPRRGFYHCLCSHQGRTLPHETESSLNAVTKVYSSFIHLTLTHTHTHHTLSSIQGTG